MTEAAGFHTPEPAHEEVRRKWSSWVGDNYPDPVVAAKVAAATTDVITAGGTPDQIYAAALEAAAAAQARDVPTSGKSRVQADAELPIVPLVGEVKHGDGTIGIDSQAADVVVRTHPKNVLTRKERVKDDRYSLARLTRILVTSRDRTTFSFDAFGTANQRLLRVEGCCDKNALDAFMREIAARSAQVSIELAHPSHGLRDPVPEQVKAQRKRAEALNKAELRARSLSGRREVKVKTYESGKDYARDVTSMTRGGWMPQGETTGRGGVSAGGTAGKLLLTGGLGAVTGFSRKGGKITVTWIRQLPFHAEQPLVPVPTVPEPRVFPTEPYLSANIVPVSSGDEYPTSRVVPPMSVAASQATHAEASPPVEASRLTPLPHPGNRIDPPARSVAERMQELAQLQKAGLISDDEFNAKRAALLSEL